MAGKAKRARMPDSAKPSLLAWVLVLGGMAITTLLAFWYARARAGECGAR
jgi:hypothetical protein